MNIRYIAVVPAFWLLAACGPNAQTSAFIDACTASSNMAEEICECAATMAQEELSENGVAFLIASMQGDSDVAQQLVGEMTIAESTAAGLFMVTAPAKCAAEEEAN